MAHLVTLPASGAMPYPGEGKMPDGRPCWTPHVLRSWQIKRKIAGNSTPCGPAD